MEQAREPRETWDELDRLIYECAEHGQNEDRIAILRLLKGRQLFMGVTSMNFEGPPEGGPMRIEPGMKMHLASGMVNGQNLVLLYTRADHPQLSGRRYVGIEFEEMLSMVERTRTLGKPGGLDGFLLYNAGESYFGFTCDGFAWIRGILQGSAS